MIRKMMIQMNRFIAVFIAGIAFSEVMPFLPLYIDTLGNFTHKQLNFWSGFIYSGTYFVEKGKTNNEVSIFTF